MIPTFITLRLMRFLYLCFRILRNICCQWSIRLFSQVLWHSLPIRDCLFFYLCTWYFLLRSRMTYRNHIISLTSQTTFLIWNFTPKEFPVIIQVCSVNLHFIVSVIGHHIEALSTYNVYPHHFTIILIIKVVHFVTNINAFTLSIIIIQSLCLFLIFISLL